MLEEHEILWQIKNNYRSDSAGCSECQQFWDKLEKEGEQRIATLEGLLKKHLL